MSIVLADLVIRYEKYNFFLSIIQLLQIGQWLIPKAHPTHDIACIQGKKTILTSKSRHILQTKPIDSEELVFATGLGVNNGE